MTACEFNCALKLLCLTWSWFVRLKSRCRRVNCPA